MDFTRYTENQAAVQKLNFLEQIDAIEHRVGIASQQIHGDSFLECREGELTFRRKKKTSTGLPIVP